MTVLLVCLSQKPSPSEEFKKSAARQLLKVVQMSLTENSVTSEWFDIRDTAWPAFDARPAGSYGSSVSWLLDALGRAGSVVFSIPCYWGAMSGVAKNFFDVLGGPAYDENERTSHRAALLRGKRVGAVLVGGSQGDSALGLTELSRIVDQFGGRLGTRVLVDNPRNSDKSELLQKCYRLPAKLLA